MAEKIQQQAPVNFLLSDFNTRLLDLEERNRLIRERIILLGQNLISSRDELDKEFDKMRKDNLEIKKDLEKLKNLSENIVSEIESFVKKDQILLVERMLKDFKPLEFARIKDVEDMIEQKLGKANAQKSQPNSDFIQEKNIKTNKIINNQEKDGNTR